MKTFAVIAAGGSGTRMGSNIPKQFLELNGKPVIWHTLKAFSNAIADIHLVVVVPAEHLEQAKQVCSGFQNIQFVVGGATRFHSVKNGLRLVEQDSIVFVHDAVRCLVTSELILACLKQANEIGSAIPAVTVNDSLRLVDEHRNEVVDRNLIRVIQTPQTFNSNILLQAFQQDHDASFTDEATVVERSSKKIHLIEGEQTNIKITRPLDLLIAEKILEERSSFQQS